MLYLENRESQDYIGGKRLPEVPSPTTCSKQVQLEHTAQDLIQLRFAYSQPL